MEHSIPFGFITAVCGAVVAFQFLILLLTIRDSRMSDEDFLRHNIFGIRDIPDEE